MRLLGCRECSFVIFVQLDLPFHKLIKDVQGHSKQTYPGAGLFLRGDAQEHVFTTFYCSSVWLVHCVERRKAGRGSVPVLASGSHPCIRDELSSPRVGLSARRG